MTRVRVKGFKMFTDRHGKQRCYHRHTGVVTCRPTRSVRQASWQSAAGSQLWPKGIRLRDQGR